MRAPAKYRRARRSWPMAAALAIAAAGAACGLPAQAQQAWEPVVVAAVPPAEVTDLPPLPPPAARRSSRNAPAAPAPARAPVSPAPAAVPDGLPPLARMATQTATISSGARAPAAEAPMAEGRAARDYCTNIADAAADARLAWQKKTLLDLEQELAKRLGLLEEKTAELQKWLARRDEFSKKAQAAVVTIYGRMRPDAAAAQLVAMDEETAAAVLTKLDPRNASAILNEMDATQAARLTATISGAANTSLPPRSRQQAAEKKS